MTAVGTQRWMGIPVAAAGSTGRCLFEVDDVDADRLFVHTLTDLEQRGCATDEYTVLMAAALLRKLLLDGTRLMDQVNAKHKLEPRFRISGVSPYERFIHQSSPPG